MSTDFEKYRLRKMLNKAAFSRGNKGKPHSRSRRKQRRGSYRRTQGGWEM